MHTGIQDWILPNRRTVETTTVERLMSAHGVPIFIKIDVEGYELNVIKGPSAPRPLSVVRSEFARVPVQGLQCVEISGRLAVAGKFNYAVDCEQGLVLERWLSADEFLQVFGQCTDSSVEVFWKGAVAKQYPTQMDEPST